MQVIYGANSASNIAVTAQKRLVRAVYAQTQGFPYAANLDPSLRNTDGSIRVPQTGDTTPLNGTRTAAAFTYQGSLIPGLVMGKTAGEQVAVMTGVNSSTAQPMGLLGQWVGGLFDNIGTNNQVGIWMGPDSVYDLLAPAWNDSTVAVSVATAASTGVQVLLYAGADGRLTSTQPTNGIAVARVIDRPSNAVLRIQMVI